MKKSLLLLIVISSFFSCKVEPKIDYALLSGKIDNAKGKTLNATKGAFEQTINLKDDGTFADTLHIEPGYYSLSHGRESTTLYLKPGYDLSVSINTAEFDESIKYMGIGSENNNYLAKKISKQ
jgi:hypothetical protein